MRKPSAKIAAVALAIPLFGAFATYAAAQVNTKPAPQVVIPTSPTTDHKTTEHKRPVTKITVVTVPSSVPSHDVNDDKGNDAAVGHDVNDDKGNDAAVGHDVNDDKGHDTATTTTPTSNPTSTPTSVEDHGGSHGHGSDG